MLPLLLCALLVGCGPKVFYLPGGNGPLWTQTGGGAEGRAFRRGAVEPPLQLLWSRELNGAPLGGPLLVGDLLLQTTTAPTLFALDSGDGRKLGAKGFDVDLCAPPALAGERIFLSRLGKEPFLLALDRRDRKERWKREGRFCTPLVVAGDTLLAVDEEGRVVALRAGDGEEIWQVEMGERVRAAPVRSGERVLVGAGGGKVVALRAGDGEEIWRRKLESGVRTRPALSGGRVYMGTAAGRMVALDGDSGEILWKTDLGSLLTDGMALGEGVLVVGGADRRIYGLEASSGKVLWRFATEGVVRGSPAVAGGTAYCGSSDGHLYGLEVATGRMLWKYRLDGAVLSPVSLGEQVVAVTSEKGTVYVFGF